ncbi:MAG TPA: response regulator transcription factor [bacterium]|nr:response regulator transcription factor [bacterium]
MVETGKKKKGTPERARILIVDDHPVVRQGLALLIGQQPDLSVCGEAEDAFRALSAIEALKPDLVLADVSLKGADGIELTKDIKARFPSVPVLVLSMLDESFYAERALRAGAKGYVMKQEATDKILTAIRRVLGGEVFVSDKMVSRMLQKMAGDSAAGGSPVDLLSDREMTVFQLIGRGYSTARIAEDLHLSVKTVETHRAHIKEKLNLADAAELSGYAGQWLSRQGE